MIAMGYAKDPSSETLVHKLARADQLAAEAGGTRDRRRNQCPGSSDE